MLKYSSKKFNKGGRSMDKVPICILEVKERRKEEREVRLKQGEEKKRRKSKKYLKIHLKNSLKGIEARRKSPIIYAPHCMTIPVILYTS